MQTVVPNGDKAPFTGGFSDRTSSSVSWRRRNSLCGGSSFQTRQSAQVQCLKSHVHCVHKQERGCMNLCSIMDTKLTDWMMYSEKVQSHFVSSAGDFK